MKKQIKQTNLQRYKNYERTLVHNIKFYKKTIDEYKNSYYHEDTVKSVVERNNNLIQYSRGSLSVIREMIFDLQGKRDYFFYTSLEFRLGEI